MGGGFARCMHPKKVVIFTVASRLVPIHCIQAEGGARVKGVLYLYDISCWLASHNVYSFPG